MYMCVIVHMSSAVMSVQVINLGNIAAKEPITHVFYDVTTYTPPSSRVLRFALAAIFYSFLAILMVSTVLQCCVGDHIQTVEPR